MAKSDRLGDGDICPVTPEHGQMYVLAGAKSQWCGHQAHDCNSRALWPFQYFAAAVTAHFNKALPDLGELEIT